MGRLKLKISSILFLCILPGAPGGPGCGTTVGNPDKEEPAGSGYVVSGSVEEDAVLQLAGRTATHVVALNTDSGESRAAVVNSDGTFAVEIDREAAWVMAWVDATATGTGMLLGRFASGSLDTLSPAAGGSGLGMGRVVLNGDAGGAVSLETGHGQLLEALAISETAAATLGELDDVSLRYINPDIDGNGQLDAVEGKRFTLDFHNRFYGRKANGDDLVMADLKNAFPPADVSFPYRGSGIVPELSSGLFGGSFPTAYSWTFEQDVTSTDCTNGNNNVVAAGIACAVDASSDDASYSKRRVGLEVALPPEGTYVLNAADKKLTWTDVKISDFSAGEGFLALFVRMDVSEENLTGISYRWMKKQADGTWALAGTEEISLLVKPGSPGVNLKVDGDASGKSLGFVVGLTPEGSVLLSDESVYLEGLTAADISAGISWDRVLENPGISYDDKLGMRFFFGVY